MTPDRERRLLRLLALPDEAWAGYLLRRSPLFRRLADPGRAAAATLAAGSDRADAWIRQHGAEGIRRHVEDSQGIPVLCREEAQEPPLVLLSSYRRKPEEIVIYRDALARLCRQLAALPGWSVSMEELTNLLLAHEYFHRLEEMEPGIVEKYPRAATPFGGSRPPAQCGEVAAGAFAKRVCGAAFFPAALELPLLCSWDEGVVDLYEKELLNRYRRA